MDRGQDRSLLDEWVGGPVFLTFLGTEPPEVEAVAGLDVGRMLLSTLEVRQEYVIFERYDQFGIEIRHAIDPGTTARLFVSWGGVLSIRGQTER